MSVNKEEAVAMRERLAFVRALKAELQQQQDSSAAQAVHAYTLLVDELIGEVALEVHRGVKTGTDDLSDLAVRQPVAPRPSLPPLPLSAKGAALDVFGNRVEPVALEQVACPSCGRKVAAGRFAPHLEKCMGRGRQASRNANARFASMMDAGG